MRTGQPVAVTGRFRVGSITKVFTAAAALQQVAAHRLDLDRTVQNYVPGLLPSSYPPIRISQLMDYTAGIPSSTIGSKNPDEFFAHRFQTYTPRQLIDAATAAPVEFAPGTRQHYCNIDYQVLEQVSGRSFADLVTGGIIRPLHLTSTSVPGLDQFVPGPHAHGYELVDGRYVDITVASPSSQWAAGDMISSAPDLDQFLLALVSGKLMPPAELFRIPDVPASDSGGPATF